MLKKVLVLLVHVRITTAHLCSVNPVISLYRKAIFRIMFPPPRRNTALVMDTELCTWHKFRSSSLSEAVPAPILEISYCCHWNQRLTNSLYCSLRPFLEVAGRTVLTAMSRCYEPRFTSSSSVYRGSYRVVTLYLWMVLEMFSFGSRSRITFHKHVVHCLFNL